MNIFELTGGARIGRANATFPFATLKVTRDTLDINASIVGNLVFQPSNVYGIEPYGVIPLIGQGIKIIHNVSEYPEKVIFWTTKDPEEVLNCIAATGFFDNIASDNTEIRRTILAKQKFGRFPVKVKVSIAIVVIWNIFFLIDKIPFFLGIHTGIPNGYGRIAATGVVFGLALGTIVSNNVRNFVLKEGRDYNDIKRFVIFLMFVTGVLFINAIMVVF